MTICVWSQMIFKSKKTKPYSTLAVGFPKRFGKNAKIFDRILQTFSQNFAFFHENKRSANEAKFRENMKRENFCKNAKCENFVKTMSFIIAAKINCSKKLVEFSANTAQYLKNSHFLNFRILWFFPYRSFYITMFQYYHVSILPCFNITMFQYYHVLILPCFNITMFLK